MRQIGSSHAQQLEFLQLGGLAIKGHRVLTARPRVVHSEQAIGKISRAGSISLQLGKVTAQSSQRLGGAMFVLEWPAPAVNSNIG